MPPEQLCAPRRLLARIASLQAFVILSAIYYAGLGGAALFASKEKQDPSTNWTPRPEVDPAEHLSAQG